MKKYISRILLVTLIIFGVENIAAQTVTTDLPDYPPGSTVIISGSGWQAGETMVLKVLHHLENGDNDSSVAHQPFNTIADSLGNITSSWLVPFDEDELGATLLLTADGQSSGLHAEAMFTDAANITLASNPAATSGALAICAGTSVTFTASFGCTPGAVAKYDWKIGGAIQVTHIVTTTSDTWTTNSLTNGNVVTCTVTFTNSGSCNGSPVTTSPITMTVATGAPTIGTQPADKTVCPSSNTSFSVVANGTGLKYQWQDNSSGSFANIPGATSATLNLTNVTISMNGRQYNCIVTNPCGSITTSNATLNIATVSANLLSQTKCSGDAIQTIDITSSTGSFTWTASGSGTTNSLSANNTDIEGTMTNNGNQVRTVTFAISTANPACSSSLSSTVTVNPVPAVNSVNSMSFCNGTSGGTNVVFGGNPNTSVTWVNNNTSVGLAASGTGNISAFTTTNTGTSPNVATITATPHYDNGGANCVGTPINFTLTVLPTPQVDQPSNQTVCNNASTNAVNFSTVNTGGTTTYSWTNNNTSIGIGANGTGNIGAFTATNSGVDPISGIITVTPTFTLGTRSCVGAPITFTITVNPTPSFTVCPSDMVRSNDAGLCSAVVSYTATASGTPVPDISYVFSGSTSGSGSGTGSGSVFNKGLTNVKITAHNICAPDAVCSFKITVNDTTPPVLTEAADQNVNLNANCSITIPDVRGTATDNCLGTVITQSPAIGSIVSSAHNGTVKVTVTATDLVGLTDVDSVILTAKDITAPVLTEAADQNVNLNANCSITIPDVRGTATDNCSGTIITQSPAIGSIVSSAHNGTVKVTVTATDLAGLTDVDSVILTAKDITAPVLTEAADQNVNLNANCSITIPDVRGTATDNCSGTIITQSPAIGAIVSSAHNGTVKVTVTATDLAGLTDVDSVILTAKDITAPVLTEAADQNVNINANCSITIPDVRGTATDNCSGTIITQSPAIGSIVSSAHNGTVKVTVTATDLAGLTDVDSVILTAKDITAPVLTEAADQNVNLNANCSITIPDVRGTAADNCSGTVITQSPAIGAIVSSAHNGTVKVTVTATDLAGLTDVDSVILTAKDITAPVLTEAADQNVNLNANCSITIPDVRGTATDNCSGTVITQSPAIGAIVSSAHNGTVKVTVTATDLAGLTDVDSVILTAKDITAPVITCPGNITGNYTAADCGYRVAVANPTVSDNCSVTCVKWVMTGATTGSSTLTGINYVGTDTFNVGTTTIAYTIKDAAGNSATCSFTVIVGKANITPTLTVADNSKQYSDKVTFTATIPGGAGACANTNAATYSDFYVGTQKVGTANFNPSGSDLVATLSNVALLEPSPYGTAPTSQMAPGARTAKAIICGVNSNYTLSNPTAPLTITQEDAVVTYSGTLFANTASETLPANVNLKAYIVDIADGSRGDIRNATVTFKVTDANTLALVYTSPVCSVVPVNSANPIDGYASNVWSPSLGSSEDSRTFNVEVCVNNYYVGKDVAEVTISKPTPDFVTGGGYIKPTNNTATGAEAGSKNNFGFGVKYNKSLTNLQGSFNTMIRRSGKAYHVKSNSPASLTVIGTTTPKTSAMTFKNVVIQEIVDGVVVSSEGNCNTVVEITDNGEPGSGDPLTADQISIVIRKKTGEIWYSNSTSLSKQVLDGGNVQIRMSSRSEESITITVPDSTDIVQTNGGEIGPYTIKVFPNPTDNSSVNINIIGYEKGINPVQLYVFDIAGKNLYANESFCANGCYEAVLNIDDRYPSGTYLIDIIIEGKVYHQKLIVNK